MRDFLESCGRRFSAGWFWPLVLLALPNCGLNSAGLQSSYPFNPGSGPLTGAVMCDIPKVTGEGGDCADASEAGSGMSRARAAVALASGEQNTLALDFSEGATTACGGFPRKTEFFGTFPDGYAVCLNCPQMIPAAYADSNAVCVAKCKELIDLDGPDPAEGVVAYCQANAHVSTNFNKNICFDNACTDGGTSLPGFFDPRRNAEPVSWTDTIGTSPTGNSLKRTAPTTGAGTIDFNAGAASKQVITTGDAWVEFEASGTNLSHVLGVRQGCTDPTACPDGDPSLDDIGFAISLNNDGQVYVIESAGGLNVQGPFGTYAAGERFRIHIVDNNDKTATVSYWRVTGPCSAGTICTETQFASQIAPSPQYPLQIDASFREENAIVANVTVMRIQ